ncbi:hypothetical protein WJX81_008431 [Elliptochloris bilobata]|uniref:Glycosyltransferase n=1 Tax=Elliptochloris bilobata TaxID=381761 RepID=A0AAW1RD75_9CHLO
MFRQTVHSLLTAGWRGPVVVLDNSSGHETSADDSLLRSGVEVLRTTGSLNFAQLQNVAASIAVERGLEYFFCAHPGVLVLGPDANTSFAAAAERCVERWDASQPDWGLIFFGSDRLMAVRVKAAADVHWDVFVPQYRADCDFYQSLKVSGWGLLHCDAGRIVSAWQKLEVPYGNHTAAAAVLDEHARAGVADGYAISAARAAARSPEAKVAWAMQMRTSIEYYQYKWRMDECDMPDGHLPWQAE